MRVLVVLGLAAILPGCRQLFGIEDTQVAADAPDTSADAEADWNAPTVVELPTADPSDDDPSLTEDLLELYFNSTRSGNPEIWVATRTDAAADWSNPEVVEELASANDDGTPEVSPDGLTLYFTSDRPGGVGGSDIWRATRSGRTDAWSGLELVPDVNWPGADAAGCVLPGILMLSRFISAQWDIYLAIPDGTGGTTVATAPGVSSVLSERAGCLSPDARVIYMDTDYNDQGDLYVATRASTSAPFDAPTPITALNTAAIDDDIWVAPDGRHVFFHSTRDGESRLWEATR